MNLLFNPRICFSHHQHAALQKKTLPRTIEVIPNDAQSLAMQQLKLQLQQIRQVDSVKLDMQWVQRLFSIVKLSKKIVYGLLFSLAIAVLLIVGNTIRMTVQRYQRHIRAMNLVGASRAFVRRPFLYAGAMYGLIAGVLTAFLLITVSAWLKSSVRKLALQYNSSFNLVGLGARGACWLLLRSSLLGYIGTWLAVGRQRVIGSSV